MKRYKQNLINWSPEQKHTNYYTQLPIKKQVNDSRNLNVSNHIFLWGMGKFPSLKGDCLNILSQHRGEGDLTIFRHFHINYTVECMSLRVVGHFWPPKECMFQIIELCLPNIFPQKKTKNNIETRNPVFTLNHTEL